MPLLPLIHFLFLSLFPAITTASSAGVITAPVFEKLDDLCSPYVPTPAQKYQSQQCLSLLPGAVLSFCETRRIREDECDDLFDSRGASSPVPWDDSAGPIHDPISIMPIEHFNRDPVTNALFNNATALRLYWRVNTSRNTTQSKPDARTLHPETTF
ncbi:unnamed protein product [Cyprideis torosa]|uniref:Uncharacterized protein n=1 Tax=Cyprideis torosa TaxID=163714 RepID=A0A7R8ZLS1_9CRUS|nr:unnamed protein product [Cyprideis torosa]CAG0892475.1 unnamed protein product [Cyprideis torosa]